MSSLLDGIDEDELFVYGRTYGCWGGSRIHIDEIQLVGGYFLGIDVEERV